MKVNCLCCQKVINRNPYRVQHTRYPTCSLKCKHRFDSRLKAGSGNPFYGKTHSKETKATLSKVILQRWGKPIYRAKMEEMLRLVARPKAICALKGRKRPDLVKRNADPGFQQKCRKALFKRPTKPEEQFMDMVEEFNLPYAYTGNGEVMVGTKNPDFIGTLNPKKIVEIFGIAFHSPSQSFRQKLPYNQTAEGTLEYYRKQGYDCKVIWDYELKDKALVLQRLGY